MSIEQLYGAGSTPMKKKQARWPTTQYLNWALAKDKALWWLSYGFPLTLINREAGYESASWWTSLPSLMKTLIEAWMTTMNRRYSEYVQIIEKNLISKYNNEDSIFKKSHISIVIHQYITFESKFHICHVLFVGICNYSGSWL